MRWWPAPGVEPGRVRALAEAALTGDGSEHKRARRKRAFLPGGGGEILVKVNEYESLPLWRRVGRSKARHALACALRATDRGVATLLPVVVGEQRRGGLLERCFELSPWLPDAIDLGRVWQQRIGNTMERRAWTGRLGDLVRALHEAGIDQQDLAPNNFLWRVPALYAIDFERARLRHVPTHARMAALAKLDRYVPTASAAARMRFLLAYTGGDRVAARRSWRAIEAAAADLVRRDARRWSRSAVRDGRRFKAFRVAGARNALLRRGVDPASMAAAFATAGDGGWLIRRVPVRSARDARRVCGLALALSQRALAPQPDAFAFDARTLRIAFAWPRGARMLDAGSAARVRAALVVAIDRLLALGHLGPLGSESFALLPVNDRSEPSRVLLLDLPAFQLARSGIAGSRRAEARRRVAAWTG